MANNISISTMQNRKFHASPNSAISTITRSISQHFRNICSWDIQIDREKKIEGNELRVKIYGSGMKRIR